MTQLTYWMLDNFRGRDSVSEKMNRSPFINNTKTTTTGSKILFKRITTRDQENETALISLRTSNVGETSKNQQLKEKNKRIYSRINQETCDNVRSRCCNLTISLKKIYKKQKCHVKERNKTKSFPKQPKSLLI